MCGSYFLGFVKVSFCFALLVDHHQTTIWENMCYSFQAVFANLSFFGFTSFCLPPLCAIDITKVRSYIYIYIYITCFFLLYLGGGFKYCLCSSLLGEMIQFEYYFSDGWFHHQLVHLRILVPF